MNGGIMQANQTVLRTASLIFLTAAASGLFVAPQQNNLLIYENYHLVIFSTVCALVFCFAKHFNDLFIRKVYLSSLITILLLAISCGILIIKPLYFNDLTYLFETCAFAFAVVSHVSIVQKITFHQQRATVCAGILGGLLLVAISNLVFIDEFFVCLIIGFLLLQSLISVICHHFKTPSSLQLSSSESKNHHSSFMHYSAPLADGFMLGFLPASLFVTKSAINLTIVCLCILCIGCLSLLLTRKRSRNSENLGTETLEQIQKRGAGFFKVIPITLSLFFGFSYVYNSILAGLYLLIFTWYFSLLCSSLTERGCFLNISIFTILGKFGTAFALGFLTAALACYLPELIVSADNKLLATELRVVIGILIIEGVSNASTKKGTMVDIIEEMTLSAKIPSQSQEKQPHWHNRIEDISETYGLTARQQQVFTYLARGRNAQFIADELYISLPTAKSHIYNIYNKLGVHSRQELLNLIDFPSSDPDGQ